MLRQVLMLLEEKKPFQIGTLNLFALTPLEGVNVSPDGRISSAEPRTREYTLYIDTNINLNIFISR